VIAIDGVNPRSVARAQRVETAKQGVVKMKAGKGEAAATASRAHLVVRKGRGVDVTGAGTRDPAVAVVTAEKGLVVRTVRTGVRAGGTCETTLVEIVRNMNRENHSPRARRAARTSLRSSWRR
tara:strand:- start:1127 stop:1495 length:369 start_codon:yes stop_codon:yes gene_type:complete